MESLHATIEGFAAEGYTSRRRSYARPLWGRMGVTCPSSSIFTILNTASSSERL